MRRSRKAAYITSELDDLEILNHQRLIGITLVLRADTDSPRGSLCMVEGSRFTGCSRVQSEDCSSSVRDTAGAAYRPDLPSGSPRPRNPCNCNNGADDIMRLNEMQASTISFSSI